MGRFLTRISFLMRILMPWSAREHERGVDSVGSVSVRFHTVEMKGERRAKRGTYLPFLGTFSRYIRRMGRNRSICSGGHCYLPLRTS
jgi:hypothetical protein